MRLMLRYWRLVTPLLELVAMAAEALADGELSRTELRAEKRRITGRFYQLVADWEWKRTKGQVRR